MAAPDQIKDHNPSKAFQPQETRRSCKGLEIGLPCDALCVLSLAFPDIYINRYQCPGGFDGHARGVDPDARVR